MDILFKILVLALVVVASFFLFTPLTVNVLLMSGMLETKSTEYVNQMMNFSTLVWLGSIVPAIISLFIKNNWRIALLLCPLILPPMFLFIYASTQ